MVEGRWLRVVLRVVLRVGRVEGSAEGYRGRGMGSGRVDLGSSNAPHCRGYIGGP